MKRKKPSLIQTARHLRRQSTLAERRLWSALRARRLGFKFRRQVPLCGYVVDFACIEKKVVIEVDGSQHASVDGRETDIERDARLAEPGFRVLRFWNHQVDRELSTVLEQIYAVCSSAASALPGSPSPCPSPTPGEGTAPDQMR